MQQIKLTDIDINAFPRDRSHSDDDAQTELTQSIGRDGLRNPIEVTPIDGETPYALLSGFRRVTAVRYLAALNDKWQTIPAFIRQPADIPDALRLIAEENAIRADISAWDQARYAVEAYRCETFDTVDAAIAGLYANLSRQKRSRLRAIADVVFHFEGILSDPHTYSQQKLTRIAAAIRGDFTDLMHTALSEQYDKSAPAQWATLTAVLAEAEAENAGTIPIDTRKGRPRRHRRFRDKLSMRREYRKDGWTLVFKGDEATGALMERIMDEIEWNFAPMD